MARGSVAADQGKKGGVKMTPVGQWVLCGEGAGCPKPERAIHYDHFEMKRHYTTYHSAANYQNGNKTENSEYDDFKSRDYEDREVTDAEVIQYLGKEILEDWQKRREKRAATVLRGSRVRRANQANNVQEMLNTAVEAVNEFAAATKTVLEMTEATKAKMAEGEGETVREDDESEDDDEMR